MIDDFIRNMEREEAMKKRATYDKISKAFEWKVSRGKINNKILEGINDPVAIDDKLLLHELEILENVP